MLRATILLLCIVSALAAQRAAPRSRNTARNTSRAPARPRAAPARVAPRRTSPPPPPVQSRRDDPRNYDADGHYVHSFASLNPGTFYKIIVENNVTLFRYTRGNEPGVRKAQVLAQGVETAPTALSVQAIRRAPARGAPARRTTTKRTRAAPTTRPGRGRRGAVEATLRRAAGVSSTTTTTTTATVSNAENSTPTPDAPPVAQQPPVPPTVDPAAPPAPHFHPGEFAQFPGGDRKVIAFQVSFDGDGCGTEQAPAPCKPDQCSNSVITELINGSGKSVASFYNTVSRGLIRMKLNDADIFPVTIAAGTKFLDIPSEVERVLGNKEADHLVFFLPQDYKRGNFADAKTGAVGLFGAKATWMRQCVLTFLIHEIGHNLALSHSGGDSGGVFKEYYDVSSIMSLSGETGWNVGPYRGLGSNQLWHLSLLPASGILDITRDGQYTIPASLSSNGGVRAARIFTSSKGAPLWVEWREAANQDVDLGANADRLEDALRVDGDGGNFLGSLLVKELLQSRKSRLVVVIPKNAQATARGVTISHGATTGVFTVSGIGSPEAEAAALAAQRYARLKTDVMRADFTVMKGDLVEVDPTFQRQGGWVFVIDEVGFGAVREEDLEYLN